MSHSNNLIIKVNWSMIRRILQTEAINENWIELLDDFRSRDYIARYLVGLEINMVI